MQKCEHHVLRQPHTIIFSTVEREKKLCATFACESFSKLTTCVTTLFCSNAPLSFASFLEKKQGCSNGSSYCRISSWCKHQGPCRKIWCSTENIERVNKQIICVASFLPSLFFLDPTNYVLLWDFCVCIYWYAFKNWDMMWTYCLLCCVKDLMWYGDIIKTTDCFIVNNHFSSHQNKHQVWCQLSQKQNTCTHAFVNINKHEGNWRESRKEKMFWKNGAEEFHFLKKKISNSCTERLKQELYRWMHILLPQWSSESKRKQEKALNVADWILIKQQIWATHASANIWNE